MEALPLIDSHRPSRKNRNGVESRASIVATTLDDACLLPVSLIELIDVEKADKGMRLGRERAFSPIPHGLHHSTKQPMDQVRPPSKTVIGVLTPHTGGFYYGAVMNGILGAVKSLDAVAIAFETTRLGLLKGREVLAGNWIDGWLAINEFQDSDLLAELRARGQPIVHVHSKPDIEAASLVLPDNIGGATFVTHHLLEHGHRRIAFAGNLSHVDIAERLCGYRDAMEAAGLKVTEDLVFDTPHHKEADGSAVARQILTNRATDRITALVAATDRLALGAMSSMAEEGVEIPRDFALVGFDDVDAAQFAQPPLTTVRQSFVEAAECAVGELLQAIRQGRLPRALVRVPTQPILRRSCGCLVSRSLPPSLNEPEQSRQQMLTDELLRYAGRHRPGSLSLNQWPEASDIARVIRQAAERSGSTESVKSRWWSGFLQFNRDAESAVRVMELLEASLQKWCPGDVRVVTGVLRDLRVALMHEWQRTERVMVAHYESITESAYRLSNALSSHSAVDPSHDLGWIRWSNPRAACCALWSDGAGGGTIPPGRLGSTPPPPPGAPPIRLQVTGEYSAELGSVAPSRGQQPIRPSCFPPEELIEIAYREGALVSIAGVPRGRGAEHGLLAVVAPLAFEHLEYIGTPGDWAVQLGAALDRAAAERELRASAELDALTGLANRATLLEAVERLRTAEGSPGFALLFIDLDDFKKVNDSLGHLAGDQLLIQMAERLVHELKGSARNRLAHADDSLVARPGGDEFVIAVSGVEEEEEVVAIIERIQARLLHPYVLQDQNVFVSASIGVTLGRGTESSALELLRDADTAMYRAKVKGRSRHEIFHRGMHRQALEKLNLDARLRLALEQDELELWYQPIIELATGLDVGAEALIRWRHPERGLLSPARFLAVAEDVGLAIPFSEWVIRRACKEASGWQVPGGRRVYVNVNVPAAHIKDPGFVEFVQAALEDNGLSPHSLGMEVVESTLLDEPEKCAQVLAHLIGLGVRVAIDDFGTGYSSLSYLRDFPASTLKIDRSFVTNIPNNARDNGITRAIIAMGQGLGLSLVAEGIETPEQLEFLKLAGCDFAQGYYISRPLEVKAYAARVEQFRTVPPPTTNRAIEQFSMTAARLPTPET